MLSSGARTAQGRGEFVPYHRQAELTQVGPLTWHYVVPWPAAEGWPQGDGDEKDFGGVPAAVSETPDWKLCGERRDGKLVSSKGPGRPEAVPLDQPLGIVTLLELQQRPAQLLDSGEEPHPE